MPFASISKNISIVFVFSIQGLIISPMILASEASDCDSSAFQNSRTSKWVETIVKDGLRQELLDEILSGKLPSFESPAGETLRTQLQINYKHAKKTFDGIETNNLPHDGQLAAKFFPLDSKDQAESEKPSILQKIFGFGFIFSAKQKRQDVEDWDDEPTSEDLRHARLHKLCIAPKRGLDFLINYFLEPSRRMKIFHEEGLTAEEAYLQYIRFQNKIILPSADHDFPEKILSFVKKLQFEVFAFEADHARQFNFPVELQFSSSILIYGGFASGRIRPKGSDIDLQIYSRLPDRQDRIKHIVTGKLLTGAELNQYRLGDPLLEHAKKIKNESGFAALHLQGAVVGKEHQRNFKKLLATDLKSPFVFLIQEHQILLGVASQPLNIEFDISDESREIKFPSTHYPNGAPAPFSWYRFAN